MASSIPNDLAEMCFTIARENGKNPWGVLYTGDGVTALNWVIYLDEAKERLENARG